MPIKWNQYVVSPQFRVRCDGGRGHFERKKARGQRREGLNKMGLIRRVLASQPREQEERDRKDPTKRARYVVSLLIEAAGDWRNNAEVAPFHSKRGNRGGADKTGSICRVFTVRGRDQDKKDRADKTAAKYSDFAVFDFLRFREAGSGCRGVGVVAA